MVKNEFKLEGSDYLISLSKLISKNIVDIAGYSSNEFGEPVFNVSYIVFEDGTKWSVEGEHDIAYLTDVEEGLLNEISEYHDEETESEEDS